MWDFHIPNILGEKHSRNFSPTKGTDVQVQVIPKKLRIKGGNTLIQGNKMKRLT